MRRQLADLLTAMPPAIRVRQIHLLGGAIGLRWSGAGRPGAMARAYMKELGRTSSAMMRWPAA